MNPTQEYDTEIAELTREIDRLMADEADPEIITELERERDVLRALLQATLRFWEIGEGEPALRRRFEEIQAEPWDFAEAYTYVYESAAAIDTGGEHEEFVRAIRRLRPEEVLRAG